MNERDRLIMAIAWLAVIVCIGALTILTDLVDNNRIAISAMLLAAAVIVSVFM